MTSIQINWDEVPDTLSKEQMCKICHISKNTARRLLLEGIVPCEYTGKKSRCFSIKKDDLRTFVEGPLFRNRTYFNDEKGVKQACTTLSVENLPEETVIAMKVYFTRKLAKVPDVLTVREVSELIGYSRNQINRWCSSGKLKCFIRQHSHYIPKAFLIAFFCSATFRSIKNKSEWHRKTMFNFSKHHKVTAEHHE